MSGVALPPASLTDLKTCEECGAAVWAWDQAQHRTWHIDLEANLGILGLEGGI